MDANLFIVGQPKSGTSALFSFLRQHSAIAACRTKEPLYFGRDINSQFFHLSKLGRNEDIYRSLFSDTGHPIKYQMDASTAYLYSQTAAQEIYRFNPSAKIIMMFREPVDFLYTYHKQLLRNTCKFEIETDFLTALDLETARKRGEQLPKNVFERSFLYYSERVKYREHIQRFLSYFPREQIKIILYDDFKADNQGVFSDVIDFLGLPAEEEITFTVVNQQVDVRNRALKQFLDQNIFPIKIYLKKHLSKKIFSKARNFYRSLVFSNKPVAKLDPQVKEDLKGRYLSEVIQLGELLNRDLVSEWGYGAHLAKVENNEENALAIS